MTVEQDDTKFVTLLAIAESLDRIPAWLIFWGIPGTENSVALVAILN